MWTALWLLLVLLLGAWAVLAPAAGQGRPAGGTSADNEDWGGLPPGPGREEVYETCDACHSVKLVSQQRLSRDVWDETLDWMVEEQDMPELDPEARELILDYLGTYLSDKTPR